MTARPNPYLAAPDFTQALIAFSMGVAQMGLEESLMKLVKTRASQLNGCARCLQMHALEARAKGETEERLYLLSAWREADCFTPRERAALAWTDSLIRLSETHAPDADYQAVGAQFTPQEQVALTILIGVINTFNLLGAGFKVPPMRAQKVAA